MVSRVVFSACVALLVLAVQALGHLTSAPEAAYATGGPPSPMPTRRTALGVVSYGGKIYAIGGNNENGVLATVEAYDPSTNTWAERSPMPVAATALAVAVVGDAIYAVGGYSVFPGPYGPISTDVLQRYDPVHDTWTVKPAIPSPRAWLAAASSGGKLYVFGGYWSGDMVDVYDPATDAWTALGSMPVPRQHHSVVTLGDGTILVVGGSGTIDGSDSRPTATVLAYRASSNTWSTKTPMLEARLGSGVVVKDDHIYVFGGVNPWMAPVDTTFEYDPSADSWTQGPVMPPVDRSGSGRAYPGAAVGSDGRMYVIGGSRTLTQPYILDTVAVYDPAAHRWVGQSDLPVIQSFTVNGGALGTSSIAVNLALHVADTVGANVAEMSFSNDDGTTWSAWEPYAAARSWTLSAGDGQKSVTARVRDGGGNVLQSARNTIVLDTSVGTSYGVTIDNAAVWTNTVAANLSIPAAPGAAKMMLSNYDRFGGAYWEPYDTHKAWTLEQVSGSTMTLVVYVRFGDASGNELPNSRSSDSIILDITPPTGSVAVGSAAANGTVSAQSPVRTLQLTASDSQSGAAMMMRLSNRPDFAGAIWKPFAGTVSWDFTGGGTVYAQFRDGAGNLSQVYSQTLPGSPPPGSSPTVACSPRPPVVVNLSKLSGTLLATLTTTGANNGLRAVRFDSFTGASVDVGSQTSQTQPFAVSIPAGQEPTSLQFTVRRLPGAQSATVRLVVIDGCGEWSTLVGGGPGAW